MLSKQITVFIENREGRLGEVLKVLKDNNINILSLSLADTSDYGLLRIIVDDPVKGSKALSDNGFMSKASDVLIVKIDHTVGALSELITRLAEKNVNVEYMYGLSIYGETASVVVKVSDVKVAQEIFKD